MSGTANIALAALLHDLGKLYQRAYWGNAPEGFGLESPGLYRVGH